MKIKPKHNAVFCSKYFKALYLRPSERRAVGKLFVSIAATEAEACSSGRMNMNVKKASVRRKILNPDSSHFQL